MFLRILFFIILLVATTSANAQEKLPKLVSLNMCADPYLVAYAAPQQILALTRLSQDPSLSAFAAATSAYPATDGRIEDILSRRPDIVITSPYSDPHAHALLAANGIKLVTLAASNDYAHARAEIIKLGKAIGREPQAKDYLARLDAQLAEIKIESHNISLLNLQRRGITTAAGHILDDIITRAGAHNAARNAAKNSAARNATSNNQTLAALRLESVFALNPDFLLLSGNATTTTDSHSDSRGSDILIHPALAAKFPPEKRIHLNQNLTLCAGAATPLAIKALQKALKQKLPR